MSDEIIKQIEDDLVLSEGEGGWVEMGGKGSGHYRHRGRKGKRGGSAPSKGGDIVIPKKKYIQDAVEATAQFLKPGDIKGIKELPQDDFLAIPGTNKGDTAFLDTKTNTIVINELKAAMRGVRERSELVAHEIGHVVGDKLAPKFEEDIVNIWDKYSSRLSGPARYSASEGFAQLFAMKHFDQLRLKRIMSKEDIGNFDTLLSKVK